MIYRNPDSENYDPNLEPIDDIIGEAWEKKTGKQIEDALSNKLSVIESQIGGEVIEMSVTNNVESYIDVSNDSLLVLLHPKLLVDQEIKRTSASIVGTVTTRSSTIVSGVILGSCITNNDVEVDLTPLKSYLQNSGIYNIELNVSGFLESGKKFSRSTNITAVQSNLKVTLNSQWYSTNLNSLEFSCVGGDSTKTLLLNFYDSVGKSVGTEVKINNVGSIANYTPTFNSGVYSVKAQLQWKVTVGLEDIYLYSPISQTMFVFGNMEEGSVLLYNKLSDDITSYQNNTVVRYALINKDSSDSRLLTFKFKIENTSGEEIYSEDYSIEAHANKESEYSINFSYNNNDIEGGTATLDILKSTVSLLSAPLTFTTHKNTTLELPSPEYILPVSKSNEIEKTSPSENYIYTYFGFDGSDGYIQDNNTHILRVRGEGSRLVIGNNASKIFPTGNNVGTLELRFKTFNIRNTSSNIIVLQDANNTSSVSIKSNSIHINSGENNDAIFGDEEIQHFVIIFDNRLIRVFLNGCICRELERPAIGYNGRANIVINTDGADIDLYSLNYYETAFNLEQVTSAYARFMSSADASAYINKNNTELYNSEKEDIKNYTEVKSLGKYNCINVTTINGNFPSRDGGSGEGSKKEMEVDSIVVTMPDNSEYDAIFNKVKIAGQGTSAMGYYKWNIAFKLPNDWKYLNDSTKDTSDGYRLRSGEPAATKLCWKINWASSMQSHKAEMVELYDKIRKEIVGTTQDPEGSRASVYQLPFLLFVDNEFYGLVTFGPAKGDKNTFGDDGNLFMLEGRQNGVPFVTHRVPWTDNIKKEGNYINSEELNDIKQGWEIDHGDAEDQGALLKFKNAFNFAYTHNLKLKDINSYIFSDYILGYYGADLQGHHIYRFRNDREELEEVPTNSFTESIDWSNLDALKDSIKRDFKNNLGNHFNVEDLLFTTSFLKLFAATDNRGKNTYLYSRKSIVNGSEVWSPICFMQDDLDTILLLDNSGKFSIPYYVEEHTIKGVDSQENPTYYWSSENNVLYNTLEVAYKEELRLKLGSIINVLNSIVPSELFKIQKYFPEVVYNVTASKLYEDAYFKGEQADKSIQQSLGRQLEAEKYWWKKRKAFLSSYARAGEFCTNSEAISFSSTIVDPNNSINICPNQYLYPALRIGQEGELFPNLNNTNSSCIPENGINGESVPYNFYNPGSTGTIWTEILGGKSYYKKIENLNQLTFNSALDISASKLVSFSSTVNTGLSELAVGSDRTNSLLQNLNLRGNTSLTKITGTEYLYNLKTLDLRNTGITDVTLPSTKTLEIVYLPESIKTLNIGSVPNLNTLSSSNWDHLTDLTVNGEVSDVVLEVLVGICSKLSSLTLNQVTLNNITNAALKSILSVWGDKSGVINMSEAISFNNKVLLLEANLPNLIINSREEPVSDIQIIGDSYIWGINKKHKYYLESSVGNNFDSIVWNVPSNNFIEVENPATGDVIIKNLANNISTVVSLEVRLYKEGHLVASSAMAIHPYKKRPELGDFVYHDGTYSSEENIHKQIIGICFHVGVDANDPYSLMFAYNRPENVCPWGPSDENFPFRLTLREEANAALRESVFRVLSVSDRQVNAYNLRIIFNVNSNSNGFSGSFQSTQSWNRTNSTAKVGKFNIGMKIPVGYYNTIDIITRRDELLNNSVIRGRYGSNLKTAAEIQGMDLSTFSNLQSFIDYNSQDAVITSNAVAGYYSIYFPAATVCNKYKPIMEKSTYILADDFKEGNWWLPSAQEMSAIYVQLFRSIYNESTELQKSDKCPYYNVLKKGSSFWGKFLSSGYDKDRYPEVFSIFRFLTSTEFNSNSNPFYNRAFVAFKTGGARGLDEIVSGTAQTVREVIQAGTQNSIKRDEFDYTQAVINSSAVVFGNTSPDVRNLVSTGEVQGLLTGGDNGPIEKDFGRYAFVSPIAETVNTELEYFQNSYITRDNSREGRTRILPVAIFDKIE